jgi:hypothetical protein
MQNPSSYIEEFRTAPYLLKYTKDQSLFTALYYKCLMIDLEGVRAAKKCLHTGKIIEFQSKLDQVIANIPNYDSSWYEKNMSIALAELVKWHLNKFHNTEVTPANLEMVQKEMDLLISLICDDHRDFKLEVLDTTVSPDKWQVKITD